MNRGRGRKHLEEPLLPTGTNSVIETIVEEDFPVDFGSYINVGNGEYNTMHSATATIQSHNNVLFTTSNSSVSTGSFVESTMSDSYTMSDSTASFGSGSGQYQRKHPDSESSSSFANFGSLLNYGSHSNHVTQPCLPYTIQGATGFIDNRSVYNNPQGIGSGVSSEISDFSTTSEEDNDPLKDIEPTIHPVPNFDVHDYLHSLQVEFIQLKDRIFEKQQSRKDKKARQRIVDGKVKISVTSDKPIAELRVWVRREPQAATLCNDKNGDVELKKPTLLRHTHNQWLYVVDLDSVYQGKERPVYELAKVEMNERNMFEMLAQVSFKNGDLSEKIVSKSFLIRTLKRSYQDDVPPVQGVSSKRPHTWQPGGNVNKSPRGYLENEADSSASPVGSSTSTSTSSTNTAIEKIVVDHLEAQRANIEQLTFGYMMQTKRGDIAYHIHLTDQARELNLTEGVVVGFFPTDGKTKIEPLSSDNVKDAVMAGVISKSAYIEAEAPNENDKGFGETDTVCVIGMIGVMVEGSVRSGERIYTSSLNCGIAVPESHLPLGSFVMQDNTMLGMAMETRTPKVPGDYNIVKCFVCIVLGIGSKQLAMEVENILDCMECNLKHEVLMSSRKTWRRIYCFSAFALLFLVLISFGLYQYLAQGTLYWYWRCEKGAIPGHTLKYKFRYEGKTVQVNGIEFTYIGINKKLEEFSEESHIEPFFNARKNDIRYFLNLDRCAYGGITDGGFLRKTVKGGIVLVIGYQCELPVYKFNKDNDWCAYNCNNIEGKVVCHPKTFVPGNTNFTWPPKDSSYCEPSGNKGPERLNVTKKNCHGHDH